MSIISFRVFEVILFLGNACLICIIINERATSGNGNRTFLCPWVLMVLKNGFCVATKGSHSPNRIILLFCHQTNIQWCRLANLCIFKCYVSQCMKTLKCCFLLILIHSRMCIGLCVFLPKTVYSRVCFRSKLYFQWCVFSRNCILKGVFSDKAVHSRVRV